VPNCVSGQIRIARYPPAVADREYRASESATERAHVNDGVVRFLSGLRPLHRKKTSEKNQNQNADTFHGLSPSFLSFSFLLSLSICLTEMRLRNWVIRLNRWSGPWWEGFLGEAKECRCELQVF
jgi:hypothetical protein